MGCGMQISLLRCMRGALMSIPEEGAARLIIGQQAGYFDTSCDRKELYQACDECRCRYDSGTEISEMVCGLWR